MKGSTFGTPCINMVLECMSGCDIKSVGGIVNGTANFILSKMEEGYDYPEALVEAQKLGYAETDPLPMWRDGILR